MTDSPWREISLTRTGPEEYVATNARGASLRVGSGSTADFSPVELLLVAIAGCSSVDVDLITSRRAEPTRFDVVARGEKLKDERGNHMGEARAGGRAVAGSALHGVADRVPGRSGVDDRPLTAIVAGHFT